MKFSRVARGKKAEQPTSFRDGEQEWKLGLVALTAMEEIDTVATAIALCREKGSPAEAGKPIYDEGLMAATLLLACVDLDSPVEAREPFFPSRDDVLALDPDTIASLFEQQALWQEQISPSYRKADVSRLFEIAKELVEEVDADVPFDQATRSYLRLSPRTRLTLLRFMAALLSKSHVFKQPISSSSETAAAARASDKPSESVSDSPSNSETPASESERTASS